VIGVLFLGMADVALFVGTLDANLVSSTAFAGAHTLLTLAAFMAIRRQAPVRDGWNSLALSLGAIAGPCGMAALAFARPWNGAAHVPARRQLVIAPTAPRRPPAPPVIARIMDQRMRFPDEPAIESLATILRHGDLQSRCKALEAAVRSFEPRLSPLIATALSDPDQTVRALAAATSAQVSANLASRIARIQAKPPQTVGEQYDFAMLLYENGVHNVLLSHSQRASLCARASKALLRLLGKAHLLGDRGVAVAAALVRLGADRTGAATAEGKVSGAFA